MTIIENKKFLSFSKLAEKFFYSDLYIALVTIIGILGFAFSLEIYAIYALAFIISLNWIFCRDLMPTFLGMAILAMTPLARHAEVNFFDPVYYVPILVVPAVIFHLIVYPPKFNKGRFFYTTLAVAIAVTTGGLFFLSVKEYFSMPAMYYVFGLGFGMLLIYMLLQSDIPFNKAKVAKYFARMMVGIGIMGIAMIVSNYIQYGHLINENFNKFMRLFQLGNNLSNNLLLSMPFAFYLATQGKNSVFYFVVGILQYFVMVMSMSRGGILFSSIVIPFLFIITLVIAKKKDRIKFLITTAVIAVIIAVVFFLWFQPIYDNLIGLLEVRGNEARVNLYKLAWNNFLKHPIFGTGLAYDPGLYYHPEAMCIYWYHSTIFQILGSLGIVGLIAYAYQEIVRFFTLLEVKSRFNLYTLLSLGGFSAYSMVNVGYFVPLPFVLMVIYMFIVVDRYNNVLKKDEFLMAKEKILRK